MAKARGERRTRIGESELRKTPVLTLTAIVLQRTGAEPIRNRVGVRFGVTTFRVYTYTCCRVLLVYELNLLVPLFYTSSTSILHLSTCILQSIYQYSTIHLLLFYNPSTSILHLSTTVLHLSTDCLPFYKSYQSLLDLLWLYSKSEPVPGFADADTGCLITSESVLVDAYLSLNTVLTACVKELMSY